MKPLLQKLFLLFLTLCFLCSCESDSLASRPWIKGYSPRPDNYNPADYTNTFIGSSPPSALRVTVSATALTKAVLFQSGTVILDGDLSEFEVSYQRPDNTETKLCLTGSGKDHVEVYYENGTLVAEGEELEYYVTEEPIWQALPE